MTCPLGKTSGHGLIQSDRAPIWNWIRRRHAGIDSGSVGLGKDVAKPSPLGNAPARPGVGWGPRLALTASSEKYVRPFDSGSALSIGRVMLRDWRGVGPRRNRRPRRAAPCSVRLDHAPSRRPRGAPAPIRSPWTPSGDHVLCHELQVVWALDADPCESAARPFAPSRGIRPSHRVGFVEQPVRLSFNSSSENCSCPGSSPLGARKRMITRRLGNAAPRKEPPLTNIRSTARVLQSDDSQSIGGERSLFTPTSLHPFV